MKELGDVAAQGRACGNLGNTNYLLGNFQEAIRYHEEVLLINYFAWKIFVLFLLLIEILFLLEIKYSS